MCLLRHQKSMCIVYPQAQRAIIIRSRLLLLEEWLEERGREEARRPERASSNSCTIRRLGLQECGHSGREEGSAGFKKSWWSWQLYSGELGKG